MSRYRRVECVGANGVEIRERASEPVEATTVRISVQYSSVNRADIERIKGVYGGIDVRDAAFTHPGSGVRVPGYDPAGVITEVGENISADLLGVRALVHSHSSCGDCEYCRMGVDNLCESIQIFGAGTPGIGGWSEEIVVRAAQVLVLSPDVDIRGACTYEVTYGTALYVLEQGLAKALVEGPVVIRGIPGVVAIGVAQLCAMMGKACIGIVRGGVGRRVNMVKQLLPDLELVDEGDAAATIAGRFGKRPSVIIEPLGGKYVAQDIEMVANGGAVGIVGGHLGVEANVRCDYMFHKGIELYGTPRAPLATMVRISELVAAETIRPVIDRVFPLSEVVAALEYCDNPQGIGRVLLQMGRPEPG